MSDNESTTGVISPQPQTQTVPPRDTTITAADSPNVSAADQAETPVTSTAQENNTLTPHSESYTRKALSEENGFLDPATFPENIKDLLGVVSEYNLQYNGKVDGGQRCFTYNGKTTKYNPLKFVFHNLRVISNGIERKTNKDGSPALGYQIALSFPREYKDASEDANDAYRILSAIDEWMPYTILNEGSTWNGDEECPNIEVAKVKYSKCLYSNNKKMVTKDGTDIPDDQLKKTPAQNKFPKFPPVINVEVKQATVPTQNDKSQRQKSDRFKTDFVSKDGELLDVGIHNYGGLFDRGTLLNGIIQLDYISSTISSSGRNRINLSLVQAEEISPPRKTDAANGDVRQIFTLPRKRPVSDIIDSDHTESSKEAKNE